MNDDRDARWFVERMPSQNVLAEVLDGELEGLMGLARDRAVANIDLDPLAKPDVGQEAARKALKRARKAASKLARDGDQAKLTKADKEALELFILLVSRPAIFVREGKVAARPDNWPEIRTYERVIPDMIKGVGRIENAARGGRGTGFRIGDRRILTNNHVLCSLFGVDLSMWQHSPEVFAALCKEHNASWKKHKSTQAPYFELWGEFGSETSEVVRITRIAGHHLDVDMAVLELDANPDGSLPVPLAKDEPQASGRVYAVGYPMQDTKKVTPVPIFNRIFGSDPAALGKKRFSPGIITRRGASSVFTHDASTLAGSSGSALVNFATRKVVGLHFSGTYDTANNAVALWKLTTDPLLVDNGAQFQ